MKKIIALFLFSFSIFSFAQVKWMTLDDAVKAQEKAPRKILIDFYADWCAPCKMMDKQTYAHPVISDFINQNYYPVKFNVEGGESFTVFGRTFSNPGFMKGKLRNSTHEFTRFMNISTIPAVVFLDEQTMPITVLQGALTARELEPYLPFIANGEYKNITTREAWENYQKKFRTSIKD